MNNNKENAELIIPEDSNQSLSEIHEVSQGTLQIIERVGNTTQLFSNLVTNICDASVKRNEIDRDIHKMDLAFESYREKLYSDLERLKGNRPLVEKELMIVNQSFSKILDYALTLNAETETQINLKIHLIDAADRYLNKIAEMMTKLL